ncbi:MAG: hypothetical protein OXE05_04695 [Chloroflexi bacterium]|nr:hypothetical protein [Chloroflexota bacterium]
MIPNVQSVLRQPVTVAILSADAVHNALERRLRKPVPSQNGDTAIVKIEGLTPAAETPDVQQYIRTGALQFWVAGTFANSWLSNLDFNSLPTNLSEYYQRAGTRGELRDLAGAEAVWETIPDAIRMAGPEALQEFRSGRDWSHIVPRSLGGSDGASNGIFEERSINQDRGAVTMTEADLAAAKQALQTVELRHTITLTAQATVTAALVTAVVEGVFAVMEEGLRYYDGEISKAELYSRVWKRLRKRVALAVVISGLVVGLAIVFPELTPILGALAIPMAVASFVMLGYRFYSLSMEWKQRVGLEPVLTAWYQSKEIPERAWRELKSVSVQTGQGANALSNRVLEWVA